MRGTNPVVRAERSKTWQELLTGVKPTVSHLRTLGFKEWVRASDKTRKKFGTKAHHEIILRSILYDKYEIVLKRYRKVHVSRHCNVEEDTIPMKSWRDIMRVHKEEVDELPDISSEEKSLLTTSMMKLQL